MSSDPCKLEQDLCRCCHNEGRFKNLAEPFKTASLEEIYADMLKECYNIDMTPVPGMLSAVTYTICEVCIMRLRDAADFKKQVLLCEERFNDIYNRNGVKAAATTVNIDIEIKEEIPDLESDDAFKDDLPLDDKDDDYDVSEDLKTNEEEEEADEKPLQVEVRKKRKYKKRAVKSNSVKSKRKKESNLREEPADENRTEKKQGRRKPWRIQKDVNYKQVGDLYHCMTCDKKYPKEKSIKWHLKVKNLHMEYKCPYCIDTFKTKFLLLIHKLEVHNVDNRVICSLCNKIFISKGDLNVHMTNFHLLGEKGRRYKCDLCDYVTMKNTSLNKHMYNHKQEKDEHCSFCNKSFKRKATLRMHERIHAGDRRKVCAECGQAFVQKASLNYHMTKYHPGVKF